MYKFKYQTHPSEVELLVTCVVPNDWLSKDLPSFGDDVVYVDSSIFIMTSSVYIFKFSEEENADLLMRTINLSILKAKDTKCRPIVYKNVFVNPLRVHYRFNEDIGVEIVLLNHLLGSLTLGDVRRLVAIDFDDVLHVLSQSIEYDFEFGIGNVPRDVLPELLGRFNFNTAKCSFGSIFCRESKMLVSYYNEILLAIQPIDGICMVASVGVDQEKMLASVLVGR